MTADIVQVTILGITGGVGRATADAFLAAGVAVRALVRDPSKVVPQQGLIVVKGDVLDAAAMAEACAGSSVVLHGLNVPYPDWDPMMFTLTQAVLDAADVHDLTLLFPGNVYGFGAQGDAPLTEEAPQSATTRKGQVRIRLEAMLAESSVPTIVLRMGDFFGGIGEGSWMHHLTSGAKAGRSVAYPGPKDVLHGWAFLPDAGRTFVALAQRRAELPAHSVFHFAGHVVDGHTFLSAVHGAIGTSGSKTFPWMWMHLARPFVPMVRELFEMRYLWQVPVRMDGSKLATFLGEVPHTALEDAVMQALTPVIREQAA